MAIIPEKGSGFFFCVQQSSLHYCSQSRQKGRWFQFLSVLFFKVKGGNKCPMESSTDQQWGMQKVYYLQTKQHFPGTKVNLVLDFQHKVERVPLAKIWEKKKCHLAEFFLLNSIFGWVFHSITNVLRGYFKHSLEPSLPHQAWLFIKLVLFCTIMKDAVINSIKSCLYK